MERVTIYARGGFKPSRSDKNIIEEYEVEIPPEESNRRQATSKIENALDQLEAADANWGAGTTLTAQEKQAIRLAIRVVAKLSRLALGRLEAN